MSASALICLAPGSEETEAVTTIDLLVRGGINVTTASVRHGCGRIVLCQATSGKTSCKVSARYL